MWCEDDEASWLLRKICSHHRIGKKTRIVSSVLSCGELGNLATKDLDSLEYLVFVVDGDSNKNAAARVKQCERRLVLPGGEKSPEQSMFDILDSIPGDHSFWEKMNKDSGKPKEDSPQNPMRQKEQDWKDRADMEVSSDIHHSDTMEEKLSLAYRFGVTINYSKPSQKEFFHIVSELAKKNQIELPEEELNRRANQWEMSHGGISGRTAQQFVNYLAGQLL